MLLKALYIIAGAIMAAVFLHVARYDEFYIDIKKGE